MKKSRDMIKKQRKVKLGKEDRIFYTICYAVLIFLTIIVLYPVVYIVSASFSSSGAVARGEVWLYPVNFSLEGYKAVLRYKDVWLGYRNTIFYVVAGTLINVTMTLVCAYPLTRKDLWGKNFISLMMSFTMIFGGGMIPNYLLIKSLGMINTIWAMLIPGAVSIYNIIVTRTFIQSNMPDELLESTKIDGCDDFKFFFKMVLPLSKAIIAVLTLRFAVGHWNAYFNAFMYLYDKNLYPLQIFLRDVLVNSSFSADMTMSAEDLEALQNLKLLLKYSIIVVSTAPLLVIYPFVQKYFVKGVMIGSVKG